ncbi:hypothetical protein LZT27_14505 [Aeromonas veronii]|uniref:hypothetical protein n=1 Tax=Aeromonas veronii TaxID=654 RepID=UPI0023634811|nr:hypothetical protein [Aeromonas veronii]MDD1845801.1 hypothetical protein [Aeromonas veronii]
MTTQAISEYSLGTIEPTGPAKFPASLAARMIRSKIGGSAIKVLVLVATSSDQLIRDIVDVALSEHPLQPVAVQDGTARVFRGTVRRVMAPMPCMVILADSQNDPAFRSFRFAVGGEPMQVIALHDGPLVKDSGYQELTAMLRASPLQLEGQL